MEGDDSSIRPRWSAVLYLQHNCKRALGVAQLGNDSVSSGQIFLPIWDYKNKLKSCQNLNALFLRRLVEVMRRTGHLEDVPDYLSKSEEFVGARAPIEPGHVIEV